MEQGSTSWLDWRKRGVGSSDAPAIMGVCPYRTREDVLADKLGTAPPVKTNPAMELGSKWESAARALYYFETEMDALPAELVHPDYSYLRASLDGYVEGFTFLEIKFMGEKNFDAILASQKPLEHHWVQMQHQILTTGIISGTYIPYTLSEDKKRIARIQYVLVKKDNEFCEKLYQKLTDFWQEVLIRRELQSGQHNNSNPIGKVKKVPRSLHSVD